jgi:hypothetical protein
MCIATNVLYGLLDLYEITVISKREDSFWVYCIGTSLTFFELLNFMEIVIGRVDFIFNFKNNTMFIFLKLFLRIKSQVTQIAIAD